MAVICQQLVVLLELCTDMIDIALTFHLVPNTKYKSFKAYTTLLQGKKYQPKILAVW